MDKEVEDGFVTGIIRAGAVCIRCTGERKPCVVCIDDAASKVQIITTVSRWRKVGRRVLQLRSAIVSCLKLPESCGVRVNQSAYVDDAKTCRRECRSQRDDRTGKDRCTVNLGACLVRVLSQSSRDDCRRQSIITPQRSSPHELGLRTTAENRSSPTGVTARLKANVWECTGTGRREFLRVLGVNPM